jgi:hypothetical protein
MCSSEYHNASNVVSPRWRFGLVKNTLLQHTNPKRQRGALAKCQASGGGPSPALRVSEDWMSGDTVRPVLLRRPL